MQNNIARSALITLGLLLIPLVAMQFSSEVNWDHADFVIMGILIFITSLAFNYVKGKIKNNSKRIVVSALIILGFIYVWAELAVGIFTNLGS
jgi:hypothetical protein